MDAAAITVGALWRPTDQRKTGVGDDPMSDEISFVAIVMIPDFLYGRSVVECS